MIRVLHIFNIMANGGIEHFVMDRYRKIDRSIIQFDFIITSGIKAYFENEITMLGGRVFYTDSFTKNPLKTYVQIKNIVRLNNYQIVHRHTGNAIGYFDLRAAKAGGAKHLIIHSHNNSAEKIYIHKLSQRLLAFNCIRLACSNAAGKWLFGNKTFQVVNNAIATQKFVFSNQNRIKFRRKYKINEDTFVIGHIGRFDFQKNHEFLVDILKEIVAINPNTCLMCIGDGHLRPKIKEKACRLGIQDKIILTGPVDNVNEIINCFDVFCFPSRYEGFPITLIEAQVNGLLCYAAKNNVTYESNLTGNVQYISLEDGPEKWAKKLLSSPCYQRDISASQKVREQGYDLYKSVIQMENFYKGLLK